MNTSIITQKQKATPIIKPLSTIIVGFTITQMALMGILFSQSAVIVGYLLIFRGVYPLALKDKIILSLTKWLKIYSSYFQANIVTVLNVKDTQYITIQNNFHTYNNSTSTSTTTINNIQYYQSDIIKTQEEKISMTDGFLSVIKYLHDSDKIILSDVVLNNMVNLTYRTIDILPMTQKDLTIALAYSTRQNIFTLENRVTQKEIAFCISNHFKWENREINKKSLENELSNALASSKIDLTNTITAELKKAIDLLLESN